MSDLVSPKLLQNNMLPCYLRVECSVMAFSQRKPYEIAQAINKLSTKVTEENLSKFKFLALRKVEF